MMRSGRTKLACVRTGLILLVGLASAAAAQPEASCEAIAGSFTGQGPSGRDLMDRVQKAQSGNCSAAADVARRALEAEGYAKVHCPPDVLDLAVETRRLAREILTTPECQN